MSILLPSMGGSILRGRVRTKEGHFAGYPIKLGEVFTGGVEKETGSNLLLGEDCLL
jgi:hypothetical protein